MKIPFQNIQLEEKIAFQNVVSQRKKFHYKKMGEEFQNFVSSIVDSGYTLKGPYFYSLNNTPMDEIVDIEMFFPIYEKTFDTYKFPQSSYNSYFEIGPVFKNIVVGNFEKNTEQIYAELIATLEINDLEINTPFFHVLSEDGSNYTYIYLGYSSELVFKSNEDDESFNFGF